MSLLSLKRLLKLQSWSASWLHTCCCCWHYNPLCASVFCTSSHQFTPGLSVFNEICPALHFQFLKIIQHFIFPSIFRTSFKFTTVEFVALNFYEVDAQPPKSWDFLSGFTPLVEWSGFKTPETRLSPSPVCCCYRSIACRLPEYYFKSNLREPHYGHPCYRHWQILWNHNFHWILHITNLESANTNT